MQPNLGLLLPTILKFYSLPPLLVSNSSCLFIQCQFLYANYSTVLPYFPKYCTIRLKCFIFVFKISVDRRRDKDVLHTYRATFGSVLSRVRLFETLWTAAHQASLSITNTWSLLKLMSIESVMPSNHLAADSSPQAATCASLQGIPRGCQAPWCTDSSSKYN